jgi:hypothetical protein
MAQKQILFNSKQSLHIFTVKLQKTSTKVKTLIGYFHSSPSLPSIYSKKD